MVPRKLYSEYLQSISQRLHFRFLQRFAVKDTRTIVSCFVSEHNSFSRVWEEDKIESTLQSLVIYE